MQHLYIGSFKIKQKESKMKESVKIEVFYKKHNVKENRITYCPNCLRVGYPLDFCDFGFDSELKSYVGRCKQCGKVNKLELGREIVEIKLKPIKTFIMLFAHNEDKLNFILKPYSGGFKKWYGIGPAVDYRRYREVIQTKKIAYLGNYRLEEIHLTVEKLYNKSKLPLCYCDEIGPYTLEFKEVKRN